MYLPIYNRTKERKKKLIVFGGKQTNGKINGQVIIMLLFYITENIAYLKKKKNEFVNILYAVGNILF